MSGFLIVMTYITGWWIVLFMLLPIGVKRNCRPEPGHSTGAPEKSYLGMKVLAASVIMLLITSIIVEIVEAT